MSSSWIGLDPPLSPSLSISLSFSLYSPSLFPSVWYSLSAGEEGISFGSWTVAFSQSESHSTAHTRTSHFLTYRGRIVSEHSAVPCGISTSSGLVWSGPPSYSQTLCWEDEQGNTALTRAERRGHQWWTKILQNYLENGKHIRKSINSCRLWRKMLCKVCGQFVHGIYPGILKLLISLKAISKDKGKTNQLWCFRGF